MVKTAGSIFPIKCQEEAPGNAKTDTCSTYLQIQIELPGQKKKKKLLQKLVQQFGQKWTKIAEYFPGRPDTQIKNKWKTFQSKRNRLVEKKNTHIKKQVLPKKEESTESETPEVDDELIQETINTEVAREVSHLFDFDFTTDYIFEDNGLAYYF